jgi:Mrp family chromosome partitioning ATPase
LLWSIDTRLLTSSDVEAAFAVPVLTVMPPASRRLGRRRNDDQREFYAGLATRLGYVADGGPGVLTVSCSGSGRSSADIVAGLAAQLAALDRRVIVVEAELRATTVGMNPAEARVAGLRAVLEGRSSLAQELTQVSVVDDAVGQRRPSAVDDISYQVLPAGGPASNPGALLGRSAVGVVLNDARLRASAVIVQAATPKRVSESLPVAALSDGIVLIAELHHTTHEDAAAARRALEGIYGRVLGVIVMPRARRRNIRGVRWSGATAAGSAEASGGSAMLTGGGALRGAIVPKAVIALALTGVAGGGYAIVQALFSNRSPTSPAYATSVRPDRNQDAKPPVDGSVLSTTEDQCSKEAATVVSGCPDRAPADRDEDRIPHRQDGCSNTPARARKECPHHAPAAALTDRLLAGQATRADRDGDYMPNRQDSCPNTPASTANGCPHHMPTDPAPARQPSAARPPAARPPAAQPPAAGPPAARPPAARPPAAQPPAAGPPAARPPAAQPPAAGPPAARPPAARPPAAQLPAAQALPDRDGDGIPNRQDSCPNKPASTPNGCPHHVPTDPAPIGRSLGDRDGDGIPNRQDSCPNKPASTPNGCPNSAPPDPAPPRASGKLCRRL